MFLHHGWTNLRRLISTIISCIPDTHYVIQYADVPAPCPITAISASLRPVTHAHPILAPTTGTAMPPVPPVSPASVCQDLPGQLAKLRLKNSTLYPFKVVRGLLVRLIYQRSINNWLVDPLSLIYIYIYRRSQGFWINVRWPQLWSLELDTCFYK